MRDLLELLAEARLHLQAGNFSNEEIDTLLGPALVQKNPNHIRFKTLEEIIEAARTHYRGVHEEIVSCDDPRERTVGYGTASGSHRWFVGLTDLKTNKLDPIYKSLITNAAGRAQIARMIMTATRSEPPPPPK